MIGHRHSSNLWLLRPVTDSASGLARTRTSRSLEIEARPGSPAASGPRPGPAWAECRRTRLGAARVPMNRVAEVAAKADGPPVAITVN